MNADVLKRPMESNQGRYSTPVGQTHGQRYDGNPGDAEKLIGKLQERYGLKREQAERDLNELLNQRRTA